MIPDFATIARRRHTVTIIVRACIVAYGVWCCYQVAIGPISDSRIDRELVEQLGNDRVHPDRQRAGVRISFLCLDCWPPFSGRNGGSSIGSSPHRPDTFCPKCGYSLKDLKSPICPECGTNLR